MDLNQFLFNLLADPNIVYLLLIIGFYGLLYEITHPGLGAAGIVGTILLISAFYGMQALPTNYCGVALIGLAIFLFIAEAKFHGLGILLAGGIISMILGSILLFNSDVSAVHVSLPLILMLTATTAAITILLIRAVMASHRKKVLGGQEGLIGEKGKVFKEISPSHEGKVSVHGEIWNARSDENCAKDEKIKVVKVEGMLLTVQRVVEKGD